MGIKNIFWDNDGVLVDTEHLFYKANVLVCEKHGIDFTLEEFKSLVLEEAIGPWEKFRDKGFDENEIILLKAERDRIYNGLIIESDPAVEGIYDVLKELSQNRSMAIVTSSKRLHFENIHKKTDLLKFFEFSLTLEDYKRCKPLKDPYIKALQVMGAKPSETVVIEDSKRGLKAAVSAGLRCIVIETELTKGQDFKDAYKVVKNVSELPAIIERM